MHFAALAVHVALCRVCSISLLRVARRLQHTGAMSKRRDKKLALKRETLRKLDQSQLGGVAGGWTYRTYNCAGDQQQAGASGGCNTSDLTNQQQNYYYGGVYYFNAG